MAAVAADDLDARRILLFIAFAYGIAWAVGGVVFLTGGLRDSPTVVSGTPITLALVLIAGGYMWAPAVAHVLTRFLTGEGFGWDRTSLRPRIDDGWPYWLAAWGLPAVLTFVGAAVYFGLFSGHYDASTAVEAAASFESATGIALPGGVWGYLLVVVALAATVGTLVNTAFAFGEEFGWRGYLLPKLLPLGGRRAMVATGVVWGVWHWPVIAMGHNYGLSYPGAPWAGLLAMVWFTFVAGTFLGWVTLRGGSVWPAAIGHAAINAVAGVAVLFAASGANPVIGPAPTGIVGSVGWSLLTAWLFLREGALAPDGTG